MASVGAMPIKCHEPTVMALARSVGQLNFEHHSTQRNLKLKLEGLKITSPGHSMDLTAICEVKTALKGKSRSVQLNLGSYTHLPLATLI
jgi:hypothetical protein